MFYHNFLRLPDVDFMTRGVVVHAYFLLPYVALWLLFAEVCITSENSPESFGPGSRTGIVRVPGPNATQELI